MSNIILKHIIDISNNSIASRSNGGSSSGGSVTSIHMCQSQASHSSQSHSQSPVRVISKGLNIGRDRGRDNIHNQYISNTNTSSNAIINTNPDFESNNDIEAPYNSLLVEDESHTIDIHNITGSTTSSANNSNNSNNGGLNKKKSFNSKRKRIGGVNLYPIKR